MPLPAQRQTALLGVNAAPDAGNRFAVSSPATLLSHEGAGHQLKINKAAAGETGSLLFQTGWSGRAKLGCAGADDFALKVSEDGVSWVTALSFDAPPMVQASCTAGSAHLVSAGAASAEILAWDLTGARAAVSCAVMALGRWV